MGEKYLQVLYLIKAKYSEYINTTHYTTVKRQPKFKMDKGSNWPIAKNRQMSNNGMKRDLIPLATREGKLKGERFIWYEEKPECMGR
jgi:hypothetical protein